MRVLRPGLVVGVRADGQVVGRIRCGVDSRVWEWWKRSWIRDLIRKKQG